MAMSKCRECGKDVSTKAKTCPHCGVNRPGRKSSAKAALILLGLVVVLLVVIGYASSPETSTSSSSNQATGDSKTASVTTQPQKAKAQTAPVKPAIPPKPKEPTSEWEYATKKDPMSGKLSKFAAVLSSSTLSFGFPYSGIQHATLAFRRHPRYGFNAILSIEKGQFQCDSYEGCHVLIRIDKHKAVIYDANEPSDNSTTVLFISNAYGLFRKIEHAKKLRIAATFYQEGTQVMTFDVAGLQPNKMSR